MPYQKKVEHQQKLSTNHKHMNYDKYQFVLDWDELPEDFKEEKITEYIEKSEKLECKECDGSGSTSIPASQEAGGSGEVAPDPEDQDQRDKAEDYIKAHFPIYF